MLKHLKQLIKIYHFQENLNTKINSPHKNVYDYKRNIIRLINKNIISDYKNYFEYNKLYNCLKKNDSIGKIKYEKIDTNIQGIINYLNNEDKNYINDIQKKQYSNLLHSKEYQRGFEFKNIEVNQPSNKQLQYISDFEFINNDIYNFFIQEQIINKSNSIEGNYISGDGKIIIIINSNSNLYCEIGYIKNNIFIIEYLTEIYSQEHFKFFLSYINNYGLKSIDKNNIIYDQYVRPTLFFYKIKNKEEINNEEPKDNYESLKKTEDFKFVKTILEILIEIYKFEINLKNSINNSLNQVNYSKPNLQFSIMDCYLIDENYLSEIINYFSYDKIGNFKEKFMSNNYDNIILDNKQYFDNTILKHKEKFNPIISGINQNILFL